MVIDVLLDEPALSVFQVVTNGAVCAFTVVVPKNAKRQRVMIFFILLGVYFVAKKKENK